MKGCEDKGGQVWIETVMYTLIALVMISAVMAYAIPRVEEIRDKSVISQSVNALKDINGVILSAAQGGTGNKRIVELSVRKGEIIVDGKNNRINFTMETNYVYSELGKQIATGNMNTLTEKSGGTNKVTLSSDYSQYDLTYGGKTDDVKSLQQSPTSYIISVENKGKDISSGKIIVDISAD